ncbi:hypothetical protein [Streptomyces corynorhini]|uniref:Uncharacterized protein n=1 Tax=Streptomyces corynorhini TaxID=2282652 RepID=A0A370B993_9ACTN|nr:hypothetical protein [Streptomyces corynorhini]RDG38201.1 hypothetical protein DVH02_10395 [Streptomyces corynorhini]
MGVQMADTHETQASTPEGWRGVPFRLPDLPAHTAEADGGKHDGGPKPPEAPREPSGGDQGGSGGSK